MPSNVECYRQCTLSSSQSKARAKMAKCKQIVAFDVSNKKQKILIEQLLITEFLLL